MSHQANNRSSVLFRCAGVPLVLGLLLGVLAAGSAVSGEPDAAYDDFGDVVFAPEIDQNQAVWWMWLGENSAAVANLGPFFESESGYTVRRWILTVHSDGPDPLLCFQGILNVDTSDIIALDAGTFTVQIEPAAGFTWRDVLDSEQIRGQVGGLR